MQKQVFEFDYIFLKYISLKKRTRNRRWIVPVLWSALGGLILFFVIYFYFLGIFVVGL